MITYCLALKLKSSIFNNLATTWSIGKESVVKLTEPETEQLAVPKNYAQNWNLIMELDSSQ